MVLIFLEVIWKYQKNKKIKKKDADVVKNKYKNNKNAKKMEFKNKIKFFSLNEYAINYINKELLLE